jgi:GSH-dependent disulfide-bond oxidoreductase
MWQMAGFGPMLGQVHHFLHYASEPVPYAAARYSNEAARLYRVLDRRLADRVFIADSYSIADMACWPWVYFHDLHAINLAEYPNIVRWYETIGRREAVKKAMGGFVVRPAPVTAEARRILFGPLSTVRRRENACQGG